MKIARRVARLERQLKEVVPVEAPPAHLHADQKVELDPVPPLFQVRLHLASLVWPMKPSIVTDHMDDPIAPVTPPQLVQMGQEQIRVPLRPLRQDQLARSPVQRAGQ